MWYATTYHIDLFLQFLFPWACTRQNSIAYEVTNLLIPSKLKDKLS